MKKTAHRNKKYLEWIRQRQCCASGCQVDVVAHHVRWRGFAGMGMKPSDFRTVPLNAALHNRLHHIGEQRFWKEQKIDPFAVMVHYLFLYCTEQDQINGLITSIGDYIDGEFC